MVLSIVYMFVKEQSNKNKWYDFFFIEQTRQLIQIDDCEMKQKYNINCKIYSWLFQKCIENFNDNDRNTKDNNLIINDDIDDKDDANDELDDWNEVKHPMKAQTIWGRVCLLESHR